MKKKIFLLPFLLLSSCAENNADPEVVSFLESCSLEKAIQEVTTFDILYESHTYQLSLGKEEETGEARWTLVADYSDEENITSFLEETFQGELILFDQESKLYVDYTKQSIEKDGEGNYLVEMLKTGYREEDLSGEKETYSTSTKYTAKQILDLKKDLYYTNSSAGVVQGGLYYADFLDSVKKYSMYFSFTEEGNLRYHTDNVPYVSDEEEGYGSETIVMNSLGMLVSLEEELTNTTLNTRLRLRYDCRYEK